MADTTVAFPPQRSTPAWLLPGRGFIAGDRGLASWVAGPGRHQRPRRDQVNWIRPSLSASPRFASLPLPIDRLQSTPGIINLINFRESRNKIKIQLHRIYIIEMGMSPYLIRHF